jgi:hypothetical protein
MRINSAGNIGIGTTSPDTKFHVFADANSTHGTIKAIQTDNTDYTSIDPDYGLILNRSTAYINNINTGGDILIRTSITGPYDTTAITIKNNGNVGIGTTTPSYVLDVNGSVHATSFPTSSDARFKTEVKQIQNALFKIKSLNGVSFEWNDYINGIRKGYEKNEKILGFIAQEVEKIIPEVVQKWRLSEDLQDARSLDYTRIIPVIVEAIKEQQNQIDELRKLINEK